jgi:hypothetical protein
LINSSRLGALSAIVAGVAGMVWFVLELAPPNMGFDDTDDPSVSLQFLHLHADLYQFAAIALIVMGIALAIAVFAASDVMAPRADRLALRSVTAFGLFAAVLLFMHGVLRGAAEPLLYIDSLDHDWGQAGYLVLQLVGIHGFAQGGLLALCIWAVGVSLIGLRTGTLPRGLCLLGVLPAIRILGLLIGPTGLLPDGFWFVGIAAIPGTILWCLLLGIVMLRRSAARPDPSLAPA